MAQLLVDLSSAVGGTGLAPQTLTATAQGPTLDLGNGEVLTNAIVEAGNPNNGSSVNLNVQVEQWDGTTATTWAAIPNMIAAITQVPSRQVLIGLRTYRYARVNANTVGGTTASYPVAVEILCQPKSSGGTGNYSRSPNVN